MQEAVSHTKADVKARVKGLDKDTAAAMVCAMVGHSRIQTYYFGYYCCSRCGATVGDTLAGVYDTWSVVIVGHDCEVCRKNATGLTWRDTWMAADPFPKEGGRA